MKMHSLRIKRLFGVEDYDESCGQFADFCNVLSWTESAGHCREVAALLIFK